MRTKEQSCACQFVVPVVVGCAGGVGGGKVEDYQKRRSAQRR
jgi:hypothetical protein